MTIVLLLWYAGLKWEVATGIATASRRKEVGCSRKTGGWEASQSRNSPDKWLLREEVAERRGALAKGPLSQEVAHKDK